MFLFHDTVKVSLNKQISTACESTTQHKAESKSSTQLYIQCSSNQLSYWILFLFSRLGVVSDCASSHFFKECVKVPFMHLKAYLRNACRYYLRIFTFHYRLRKDIIYESLCSFTEFYPSLRSFTECVKILFTHLYASLRNV